MAESDLIRGNVDTIILKVLYEGDRYGYDLIKQINARGDGQWEIKQPTVYACLKRLEKQGFISSYWDSSESDGGRRKYYSLTESGREVFLKYKSEFERANALFGELITGPEPNVFIQPEDDFSDVEDEGYALPKRKRERKPKKQKPTEPEQLIEEPTEPEFIPEDVLGSETEEIEEAKAEEPIEQEQAEEEPPQENPVPAREAQDPRAIIDSYYASERGESYADARKRSGETYDDNIYTPPPPAPVVKEESAPDKPHAMQPPAPIQPVSKQPAPVPPKQVRPVPEPLKPSIYTDDEESDARREYKTVLGELVERFEMATPDIRTQRPQREQEQEQAATAYAARSGGLDKVEQTVRTLGDDIVIRSHNDSAKEYAKNNYYFSNRLWLTHYTIMCVAMFIVGLALFITFVWGLNMREKYDYLMYIFAGLLPIAMVLAAVSAYASNPDKLKRVNVNYKVSVIIRIAIMVQVAVIVYCLNLIWGMPVGFSAEFVPSLVLPCAYALFIPISEIIFMNLLKSGNYADYTE